MEGVKAAAKVRLSKATSYSTNVPEYAKPFYEELLKQSGKQIYQTDSSDARLRVLKNMFLMTGDLD
jgi:hypothetical protein